MIHSIKLNILKLAFAGAAVAALSSCAMIKEDNDDCPSGLFVRFVYDYNTVQANGRSADLFSDHVGHLQLFVFDEEGRLVASRSVSNSALASPLAEYGYTMHFNADEVAPGHSYRLQAIAMDKDWDEALATTGAKYRISASPFDHENNLTVSLDHFSAEGAPELADGEPSDNASLAVDDSAPLDIFWHTLKVTAHEPMDGRQVVGIDRTTPPYDAYPADNQRVRVEHEKATYATVSLIRDTKHLTVGLHQIDPEARKTLTADQCAVTVTDANCCVDHANRVNTHHTLRYTPYAVWTVRLDNDGTSSVETVHKGDLGSLSRSLSSDYAVASSTRADEENVVERQAHYNLMFNRLMLNNDSDTPAATLDIKDKNSGATVASINLPHYLSMGRDAFALSNYGHQEYLDREYDYHLDFFLSGAKWVAVEIHVLSWSKRVQNVEF